MQLTWLGQRLPALVVVLLAALLVACSDSNSPDRATTRATGTGSSASDGEPTGTPEPTETPEPEDSPSPRPTATPDFGYILPDLESGPSSELYISIAADGTRSLHFSTLVQNTGEGPLQISSEHRSGSRTPATQIIQTRDAGQAERFVGQLQVNEAHGHWHLDDFADYELWTLTGDRELDEMVASSKKVTFCLIDQFPMEEENYGDGPQFGPCDPHAQGISPGWGEIYEAWLPGQSLDITELPDGLYALRTVLDPDGQLLESETDNNEYVMFLDIRGTEVYPAEGLADDEPPTEPTPKPPL